MLGVLREVSEEYAVVSLPTMLTGYIRRGEGNGNSDNDSPMSSPPLTKVLPAVNTIMAFYVVSTMTESVSKKQQQRINATKQGGVVPTTTTTTKRRRIELSVLPGVVNKGLRVDDYLTSTSSTRGVEDVPMVIRGRIVSVEDHGCIVDLGGAVSAGGSLGRKAFLKFDNVEGAYDVDADDGSDSESEEEDAMDIDNGSNNKSSNDNAIKRKLNPGRIYDFTILPSNIITNDTTTSSSASTSIIQLALPLPNTLATYTTTPTMMTSLSTLQPGMLISNIAVEAYAKNGLCVNFNEGVYRGSLDEDHLGGHRSSGSGSGSGGNKGSYRGGDDGSMWWKNVFKGKHAKVRS